MVNKKQIEDMRLMHEAMKRSLKHRFKREPDWEDKHPILATLIVMFEFLFNPALLFILAIIILIVGVAF